MKTLFSLMLVTASITGAVVFRAHQLGSKTHGYI